MCVPWSRVLAAACLVISSCLCAGQQSLVGATLAGTVLDPSGAAVPGASVVLTDEATQRQWRLASDVAGRFRFSFVPPGEVCLTVRAAHFAELHKHLVMGVGQAVDLPVPLGLAADAQQVSVTAEAPLIETARTQVTEAVTPAEVQSLPLNGRNYLDLALLAPNVSRTNTGSNQRFAETSAVPGTGISVAGQRNLNNSFLLDGLSANDDAAELAGSFYSPEVIREFGVVTSGVAEYGRGSGGVINMVTRSGGNTLRGNAYGYLRNQRMDAANPLSGTRLPLTQAQFGATLGGPVARDRTFYFVNFELMRQNSAGVITIAPNNASAINQRLEAAGFAGPRIGTGSYPSTLDTSNAFAKLDHRWSASLQSAVRYHLYDAASLNARNVGGLSAVSRGAGLSNRDQTVAINTFWTADARTLVESRLQYTHSALRAPANDPLGPAVNISGVASFGTSTVSPTGRDIDLFETAQTVTHDHGGHSAKAGVDVLYNRVGIDFPGALQGVYTFSNLANFLAGKYVNFQQAFGPASTRQGNPNLGLFVEDEWRVRRGLTLSYGARYDLQFLDGPMRTDINNIAPRAGLAWAPWGNERTVVRASYGMFYDRIPLRAVSNALQRDGVRYKLALVTPSMGGAPVFPGILAAFPSGLLTNITSIDPGIEQGYSYQGTVQVEHALTSSLSAEVGYMHLRGLRLLMSRNLNVPTTTDAAVFNLGRPDARFANNAQYQAIGDSWYDGMTLGLKQRAGRWASFRLSYTFSKAQDDAGNFFFSAPQDNFNIRGDKGASDNDQRHRLTVSGTLLSPVRAGGTFWQAAGRGWLLSYIFSGTSALPLNPQATVDLNRDSNPNDRPAGFARNSFRGFGFHSLDLRLARRFSITERVSVEAMADGFNVLNHRNDMLPNSAYGVGPLPRPTFGQPTAVGDPRQVQLGLRVSF